MDNLPSMARGDIIGTIFPVFFGCPAALRCEQADLDLTCNPLQIRICLLKPAGRAAPQALIYGEPRIP